MPSKRDLERERRELEEERQAIEEDRHRYDDVLPGLNDERGGFLPPYKPPELPCPPGYDLGPNLLAGAREVTAAARPPDAEPMCERLVQQSLERVRPSGVKWLWPGRIPLGKLTLLAGDPGVGKSLLTLDMAARITQGLPWPDLPDQRARCGRVLLLSAEDDMEDTIRPRLERAGANFHRVQMLWGLSGYDIRKSRRRTWQRPIVLPDDVAALEYELALFRNDYGHPDGLPPLDPTNSSLPVHLVVIDPLAAYFPQANTHDNVQVRRLLQPLVDLAARNRVAIVAVTHLNKSAAQPGEYRTMGSLAFTAVSRAVWGVARDPADAQRRLLLPIKNNLGPTPTGLAFRINEGKLEWEATSPESNWQSTVASKSRACFWRERAVAIEFLKQSLAGGERLIREVKREATDCGITPTALRNAREELDLEWEQKIVDGKNRGFWRLPAAWHGPSSFTSTQQGSPSGLERTTQANAQMELASSRQEPQGVHISGTQQGGS